MLTNWAPIFEGPEIALSGVTLVLVGGFLPDYTDLSVVCTCCSCAVCYPGCASVTCVGAAEAVGSNYLVSSGDCAAPSVGVSVGEAAGSIFDVVYASFEGVIEGSLTGV